MGLMLKLILAINHLQRWAKVRNGLFEERYEMLGRNAHYAENISQLFG